MQTEQLKSELIEVYQKQELLLSDPKVQEALEQCKQMEKAIKEVKDKIKHAMIDEGCTELTYDINGSELVIKLSYANNLKVEDISKVPKDFLTESVNMDKVKQYQLLGIETSGIKNDKIARLSMKIDGKTL